MKYLFLYEEKRLYNVSAKEEASDLACEMVFPYQSKISAFCVRPSV